MNKYYFGMFALLAFFAVIIPMPLHSQSNVAIYEYRDLSRNPYETPTYRYYFKSDGTMFIETASTGKTVADASKATGLNVIYTYDIENRQVVGTGGYSKRSDDIIGAYYSMWVDDAPWDLVGMKVLAIGKSKVYHDLNAARRDFDGERVFSVNLSTNRSSLPKPGVGAPVPVTITFDKDALSLVEGQQAVIKVSTSGLDGSHYEVGSSNSSVASGTFDYETSTITIVAKRVGGASVWLESGPAYRSVSVNVAPQSGHWVTLTKELLGPVKHWGYGNHSVTTQSTNMLFVKKIRIDCSPKFEGYRAVHDIELRYYPYGPNVVWGMQFAPGMILAESEFSPTEKINGTCIGGSIYEFDLTREGKKAYIYLYNEEFDLSRIQVLIDR